MIPTQHRILWVNSVDLVWNSILASQAQRIDESEVVKESSSSCLSPHTDLVEPIKRRLQHLSINEGLVDDELVHAGISEVRIKQPQLDEKKFGTDISSETRTDNDCADRKSVV